ncbi:Uncharacterised protein (plasmid) [Legionella adelaidensis]|uniref:Coiled-coil protein n=1 Tax=Legionella adelaidensis TaxID=45056 RepID=A0A0W0R1E5_9GAMM|nr:hypothetical protein [Legionella adelaidensis]KTC64845.1 hypothetical protein Lade_2139 [Legionella adelaidensis]VEH82984.1 Uncharacterised protein [Legionella adelaidensis]
MNKNSIFSSTSYAMLAKKDKKIVKNTYELFNANLSSDHEEAASWDMAEIAKHRAFLNTSTDLYSQKINAVNSHTFLYMNALQKKVLRKELLLAFYIFSAQYKLNEAEDRQHVLADLRDKIKRCATLIYELQQADVPPSPETMLAKESDSREKYEKFLGLAIGKFLGDKMLEFSEGKTVVVKKWMGDVNGLRLYWVWGGNLVSTVLSMLPDTFKNKNQAIKAVSLPQPFTGSLSWLLYYARFGVNLTLLLKHTFEGPWMKAEEKKIPQGERFLTQWHQRKFSLLNDSIWATANLACFFWLTGNGIFGYYGNVLTGGLLLMDVCLNTWGFLEACTKYNKEYLDYKKDIEKLESAKAISVEQEGNDSLKAKKLEEQIKQLKQLVRQHEIDWKYKKYSMINDLVYSVALLGAFTVLCSFYLPTDAILPATAISLGLVGGALCFVTTVITAAVGGYLEIAKIEKSRREMEEEAQVLVGLFAKETDINQKKFLFLEVKRLMTTAHEKEKEITYQEMVLCKDIFLKSFFPAIVFSAFVFFPLNTGIGVITATFCLAMLVQSLIDKYKPNGAQIASSFADGEYERFEQRPQVDTIKSLCFPKNGLFNEGKKQLPSPAESSDGLGQPAP